jgi:DNA excision repair protein ERCC-5
MQTKFDEVKFLLSIFGIPWVEAPGESEAQCAYLEHLRLVDFVVTDDSDAFLFGAKRVIKGLFDKG